MEHCLHSLDAKIREKKMQGLQSICRMIETNGLSEHQIIEDILQIKKENICRIVVAKGTYIDDSMGNIS
jgi:hypothetical protein